MLGNGVVKGIQKKDMTTVCKYLKNVKIRSENVVSYIRD